MHYGVIAEDGYILRALPVLLERLVDLRGDPVECRLMNGKPDFVANCWRVVKGFQYRYPGMHKVLAVCDADADDPEILSSELHARATARCGPLPFSLIFHVIKRELETWWITEPGAISQVCGIFIPFPGGNVEDSVVDPKEYIVRRLTASKRAYSHGDAERVATSIDLEALAERSPGFVMFAAKARNGDARRQAVVPF